MANQRLHFRLEYPPADRPTLVVERRNFIVLDISEQGCKFQLPKDFTYAEGTKIAGVIRFKTDKTVRIEGIVLRVVTAQRVCVISLSVGVSLALMMSEQRRLIQKYKMPE